MFQVEMKSQINKPANKDLNKAGYEYLLSYKLTVPIYDYTTEFVKRWVHYKSRTRDQMEQAARSGMANIPEGSKQKSLASYIKLAGVARGSLEELLKDYHSFARQRNLAIWGKERAYREIGEIRLIWDIIKKNPVLPDSPNFPNLPENPEKATNLLITLINQANYLIDKLIAGLESKHEKEGGFSEALLKRRLVYRKATIDK